MPKPEITNLKTAMFSTDQEVCQTIRGLVVHCWHDVIASEKLWANAKYNDF